MKFEDHYIASKEKEGKHLTAAQIKKLPDVPKDHPQYKEWEIRKKSLARFDAYLQDKHFYKAIEIGCGYGWFSNWLADRVQNVIGQDIIRYELDLAINVFARPNLNFVMTEDIVGLVAKEKPDLVVFNASLHYINPRINILLQLKDVLNPGAEIHILDTNVYLDRKSTLKAAIKRKQYFNRIGFPEMNNFYFHYPIERLVYVEWLYTPPMGIMRFLKPNESPFPWGRIRC